MSFVYKYLRLAVLLLAGFASCGRAIAQVGDTQQQDIPTVTITGKPAGPPLWKITRGQNTLWLYASLPVVPEELDWDSSRVAHILSQSELFLSVPLMKAGGLGAVLTMRARKAGELIGELRRLSPGRRLDEVVDADLGRRLTGTLPAGVLDNVGQYKPWFAGQMLMNSWIEREGFTKNSNVMVDRELERLRRKYRVREVQSRLDVELEELEAHLQQQLPLPDDFGESCLAAALDFPANAENLKMTLTSWFAGEMPVSSALDPVGVCFKENPLTNRENVGQLSQIWINNLEQALANHATSFAVIPVGVLLDDNYSSIRQWLEQAGLDMRQIRHDD